MAATQTIPTDMAMPADPVPVRTIDSSDLGAVLREGYGDFLDKRGDLLFIGLIYPIIGFAAAVVSLGGALIPLFFPISAGIGFLGPVAALGFYELARRREAGLDSRWRHFFDVTRRPSWEAIVAVTGILFVLFFAWVAAAWILYAAFIGAMPETMGDFLRAVFTTREGWGLILVGNLVGLGFAALVLTVSVVSLPMLVDCDVDARTALSTSWRAVMANKAVMFRWGIIVAVLLVLGSIPAFIGLAFVLPWLGYATWHLYTRLVDRSALATCGE
ncbi:DUF2189 domain-containing protein [Sphingosinicella terrae]|jgi:uncharacterized membrane protein|uniref:DUF2189 domain-containing protein n=1 Tax=Sphingosinicella terrae TaxID=2172047 RepID=UPI002547370A|nr:DUF2189 domain-containing protein [Sphingosinicella terrae]